MKKINIVLIFIAANLFVFFGNKQITPTFANTNEVVNQTITLDKDNKNPATVHGNIITTAYTDHMEDSDEALCQIFEQSGTFRITTPFQNISKIEVNWYTTRGYKAYIYVGTSIGKSNIYASSNLAPLGKKVNDVTETVNISSSETVQYITFSCSLFDSATVLYINWIRITYSCSYQ